MINTVIFDFDGLIVESERTCFRAYGDILKKNGVEFSWDVYVSEFLGMNSPDTFRKMEDYYGLKFDIPKVVDSYHEIELELIRNYEVPMRPGLIELLEYLEESHYRKVIATSSSEKRFRMIMEKHDLLKYFDDITTGGEVEKGKPEPDIFLKACEKSGIKPEEAIILEDSQAGILAANRAGIPVICIPGFKEPDQIYVDMTSKVCESLLEVVPFLESRYPQKYKHVVQYYETDRMGIVHHSNYIRWMEEARTDFLKRIGWDYARLEDMGIISPVTHVDCNYRATTTYGDVVFITVLIEEFKGVRLKVSYVMENEQGKLVCDGRSEHCFLDDKGRPIRMKKMHPDFCNVLSSMAEK